MRVNRKYLVAVALLAVLAVVFGLAGTGTPLSESLSPQHSYSSESVTHFVNPPTFNSNWINITDKAGQYFEVTHNLNSADIIVDITGKTTMDGGQHQRHLGGTGTPGWNRTYERWGEIAQSVVQTTDGGYAIGAHSIVQHIHYSRLLKTDSDGNVQWSKTGYCDYLYSVVQTSYGEYALAGSNYIWGIVDAYNFTLVKTDSDGNVQFSHEYGGPYWDVAYSVVRTSDGYALAGYTQQSLHGDEDFWLVKTNLGGNMQWNKTYGGPDMDVAYSLIQTSDEGYALAGSTHIGPGNGDFWLVKVDSSGNYEWNKTYGEPGYDCAYSLVQASDGGYALAGSGFANLVKTDASGNMLWSKTYGGNFNSLVQTSDGGYALAGSISGKGWFVKTDSLGNMQWNKTYGGIDGDYAESVVQTSDGAYTMAGYTFEEGGRFWLIKTDIEIGLAWTNSTADSLTLYRGVTDAYWNYVRVRIWTIEEPTWQFGDINQDGAVDISDLYVLSRNYGKTFSLLSLAGIIAVAGIHTYRKQKQPT